MKRLVRFPSNFPHLALVTPVREGYRSFLVYLLLLDSSRECEISDDPHVMSFDGQKDEYHELGEHHIASLCNGPVNNVPAFELVGTDYRCGGWATCIDEITLVYNNKRYTVNKALHAFVNFLYCSFCAHRRCALKICGLFYFSVCLSVAKHISVKKRSMNQWHVYNVAHLALTDNQNFAMNGSMRAG